LAETFITLADFLEEDRTRQLPPFERLLHTVLTICYGLFLGFFAPVLIAWWRLPTALQWTPHGLWSGLFTLYGVAVLAWSLRNAWAVRALGRRVRQRDAAAVPAAPGHIAPAVLITGATGFVGGALVAALQREGRRLIVLSRDLRQARAAF